MQVHICSTHGRYLSFYQSTALDAYPIALSLSIPFPPDFSSQLHYSGPPTETHDGISSRALVRVRRWVVRTNSSDHSHYHLHFWCVHRYLQPCLVYMAIRAPPAHNLESSTLCNLEIELWGRKVQHDTSVLRRSVTVLPPPKVDAFALAPPRPPHTHLSSHVKNRRRCEIGGGRKGPPLLSSTRGGGSSMRVLGSTMI